LKINNERKLKQGDDLSPSKSISTPKSVDETHPAYVNYVSSLKSPITRKAYVIRLKNYLRYPKISFSTFDELLKRDRRIIEQGVIDILIDMRYKLDLSFSAQNIFLCALTHFFSINDVTINRKKIKKFMSDSENKYEYRSYTAEEIGRLLLTCDDRERAIILILSSTGMRVGAVHPLCLKDLKKWIIDEQGNYIYQIQVYSSSSKYRYYTFCTPECAVAIDSYLELRKRYGEKLIKTETGWNPSNAYLIIRAFNRKSFYFNPIPIRCRTTITTNIIVPKLEAIDLRQRKLPSNNSLPKANSHTRGDLHPCHSFRIFAITQMQRAKVDKTIREMLVNHSTGLDSVYYKASEEEIYLEYLKAIDNLTISNDYKLKPTRGDNQMNDNAIIKLKEKHEADLNLIREDMNQKFNQIFSLIQQNPILANIKREVLEKVN
jgi:integrase